MNSFVMIHTRASTVYTQPALESFFRNTPFAEGDTFLLIDNDGSLNDTLIEKWPQVIRHVNSEPLSFAANANTGIRFAAERNSDLFLLNNDIIFAEGWLEPLMNDLPVIMSSVSNQNFQYNFGPFSFKVNMDLEDYAGRELEFVKVVDAHRLKKRGFRQMVSLPFFCVKIPRAIDAELGAFDESFGKGGAEDTDYCIRAYLRGYAAFFALDSLVLHFHGKSTWRGPESAEETTLRNEQYVKAFKEKWGEPLTRLAILNDGSDVKEGSRAESAFRDGLPFGIQQLLIESGKIEQLGAWRPSLAAVYCVYDDTRWLKASVESVYSACDRIYFLVGSKPWNGEGGSNEDTLSVISSLADPESKIEIIKGEWPSEEAQRNAGLEILSGAGFDYCLVVDADEVYDEAQLEAMLRLVSTRRFVPAWRAHMFTYWKTEGFRVDPPEAYNPVVFVRVGSLGFTDKREISDQRNEVIPARTGVMHHLSYARSDEEVMRKITTFSHVHQMKPDWYENVWKGWDANHEMENLNPCWPESYKKAVPVTEGALPPVLRKMKQAD